MVALSYTPIVEDVQKAVLKAALIANMRRKQNVQVRDKDDGSKVTPGDYQCQQLIEDELIRISEKYGIENAKFLMEEHLNGPRPNFADKSGWRWVVDPIDGTIGYSRKLGEKATPWAISVSLEKDGEPVLGVVYDAAKHEFGTTQADFSAIDPNHPQGKIFWAHRDAPGAHVVEDPFTVTPENANEPFRQRTQSLSGGYELPILENIPALTVDMSQAKEHVIDGRVKLNSDAKPLIDAFLQDGRAVSNTAQAVHKRQFIASMGWAMRDYNDCFSSVAGAMAVLEGRASTFLGGRCFRWDSSAAQIIFEKSGTPFVEYAVGDGTEQRSMLIAGRDKQTFERMKRVVSEMRDVNGQPILNQNQQGFLGRIATGVGAVIGAFAKKNTVAEQAGVQAAAVAATAGSNEAQLVLAHVARDDQEPDINARLARQTPPQAISTAEKIVVHRRSGKAL